MKKTKKLLAMITLITMTSTLAFQTEISAAVINQTKDNSQIQETETKDEAQAQETEEKENTQAQETEVKEDTQAQETEVKEDTQIQENEVKDDVQIQESEIKDNLIETNKNIDSIEAVKRYEENLESLYVEKEASSTALTISSFSSDLKSPQEKGKTIKFTAKAQGGSGTIKYSFVEKINGNYKEIKAYSETNTVSWKPQYVGTYTIYAVAKDSTGSMKISSISYQIKAPTLKLDSFTPDKTSPQKVGTAVKFTTKIRGVNGTAKYKYYRYLNNQYALIKDWSTNNSITIAPSKAGKYDVYVAVKDSSGTTVRKNVVFEFKDVLKLNSFTADKTSPQKVGTAVKFTTKVSGASGTVKYKYYRYLNNEYSLIKDWSTSNSITIAPSKAGKYDIYVAVKDSSGTTVRKNIVFEFKDVLKLSSFTADKTSPQKVGTAVKFTTKVSGASGTVKYKYYRYLNNEYSLIKDWSTSNSITIAPSKAGKYDIYVAVKDSSGATVRKNIMFEFNGELTLSSFTADKQSPQLKNTSITLKANSNGGIGTKTYKFYSKLGNNTQVIKDYSTSNSVTWKPSTDGNYTLYVNVKDSSGKVVTKSLNYVIKSPTKLTGKVVEADGDTDYTNDKVLPNATVKITKNGVTQTTTTNANGVYSFEKLMDGAYTITVSKTGYKTSTQTVNIPEGQANYYNSTIELISNTTIADGTASGTIYDVLTGNGVEGLTLKIRSGIGNTTGTVVKTIKTGQGGKYSVTLPAGNYCVQIIDERTISNESERYLTNTFDIKTLGNKTIGSQDGNVSTSISSQQIRIVLKWGENPRDLDSHLVGPTSSGEKFHIYFSDKYYQENSEKVADLDLDDISSYGPETTTIYNPVSGKYQFYVLNYSNRHSSESSSLASSGATVQVYIGASNKPNYTFNVPQHEGTLWKVFEYDSVTKKITPINQMSYESNSSHVGMN